MSSHHRPTTAIAAQPLVSLEAVALDTETTGLEAKTARLIQLGAVHIAQSRLSEETFSSYVAPGEPIPPAATAIHGISDATVRGAPTFPESYASFRGFASHRVVIGHSIGFDLAILKRECGRSGVAWHRPRSLDVGLLAQVANRSLPDYSLETVSAWLGVQPERRHDALGDAVTAGRIFLALLSPLRNLDIRTVAEAETACRSLTEVRDGHGRAGWVDPVAEAMRPEPPPRLDSYPYRHRVGDILGKPLATLPSTASMHEAAQRMIAQRISSVIVTGSGAPGIVTERDVLRAVTSSGPNALDAKVSAFASSPLITVPADAYIYSAIGRMTRRGVRHLGVVGPDGNLVGVVSARDLLRLRTRDAVALQDDVDVAEDSTTLAAAWSRLPVVAKSLLAEDFGASAIAGIISQELGALTRRAAQVKEASLPPRPADYAVLLLGSGGRGESLLAADQDNALIFEDDAAEDWYAQLGDGIANLLYEAGVPYCKGGVMARNKEWRGTITQWRERIDGWVSRSSPRDLLNVDIFYDFRCVHGSASLATNLLDYAAERGRAAPAFAKLLAESTQERNPPFGLLGGIKTQEGRVDLKTGGLFPITMLARVLAIRNGIRERGTPARLDAAIKLKLGAERDLAALIEAHGLFLRLVLRQQIADIEAGIQPSSRVLLKALRPVELDVLTEALHRVGTVRTLVRDLLF